MRTLALCLLALSLTGCPSQDAPHPDPLVQQAICQIIAGPKFPRLKVIEHQGQWFCYDDSQGGPKAGPSAIPQAYDDMLVSLRAVNPNAVVPLAATDALIIRWMAPTYYRPSDGMGFFPLEPYASASDGPWIALNESQHPEDVVPGQGFMVIGYSDLDSLPRIIYVASNVPSALRHELLHLAWHDLYPTDSCQDPPYAAVWRIVEHGVFCDPFIGHPYVIAPEDASNAGQ